MRKAVRRIGIGAGVIIGLIIIAVICVGLFFDVNRYKPQIEAAVAKNTGMTLKIDGKASLKVFPRIRIALNNVHLSNRGSKLFDANAVAVAPRVLPFLLHRELIVDQVTLNHPSVHIEKSAAGRMNYESTKPSKEAAGQKPAGKTEPGEVHSVRIENGELTYLDRSTGKSSQAKGINIQLSGVSWGATNGGAQASKELIRSLSARGNLHIQSIKSGQITVTDLKSDFHDEHGLIQMDPTDARVFGGTVHGKALLNLREAAPKLQLNQTASRIDLAQLPSGLKDRISGFADGAVDLSASGANANAITKSAKGSLSIRAQNITFNGIDVDALASKLNAAESMDLVRIGSTALSGLFSPPVEKAAGTAAQASGKRTVVQKLVSDWAIGNGLAETRDVAITTPKTTIAFKGDINLVNKSYQNFAVATVDPNGCSKSKVQIEGKLTSPHPSARSIGEQIPGALLGKAGSPAGSVGSQIAGILGGGNAPQEQGAAPQKKEEQKGCDHFYAGAALQKGK